MPLVPFEIKPDARALQPGVAEFLADADARIDNYFWRREHVGQIGFFPSDHELIYRTLRAMRKIDRDARRLLEWGSGFGVVAGLGVFLGYHVHGIEIDPELIAASGSLLEDHGLTPQIAHGSFIPEDYRRTERLSDLDTITVLTQADAYGDMELEIEDFDVVYAYPWPTEEEQYCDIFGRFADYGAVLLTYSMTEGIRAYRKVGASAEQDPGP